MLARGHNDLVNSQKNVDDEIVIIVASVGTNFWFLFLFVLVCFGESITVWLFLDCHQTSNEGRLIIKDQRL